MPWYSLLFIIPIIVALAGDKPYSLKREQFDKSLEIMNSNSSTKIICGVIAILFSLLPIIDNLMGPGHPAGASIGDYMYFTESQIFKCDYSDGGPLWCIILAWICGVIGIICIVSNLDYKNKNQEKLEKLVSAEEERQSKIAARKAAEKQEDDYVLSELTAKLGSPEKIVHPYNNRMKNAFIVFPQTQNIYVDTKVVPFNQLVSCEIKDESYTTVTGTKEEVTKSSNGSTVGRAIVGGLIAGPAGAIIGGATSKKKTEVIDNTKIITHHHYFAVLNLASAANPIIKVDCGKYTAKMAEEIKAIVMGIIAKRAPIISATSIADELSKLALLKEQGVLTQLEFDQQKQLLLAGGGQPAAIETTQAPMLEAADPVVLQNEESPQVIDLLEKGDYFSAVKAYQDETGCDISIAMEYVNELKKGLEG